MITMLVAVDTGGTKTLVAVFRKDGSVKDSIKFLTPKHEADYISELVESISQLVDPSEITALSVAMPGPVRNGVVARFANLGWEQFDVAKSLKPFFQVPIFVENDANLAGLAEARSLRPTPQSVLYVTISTGIGTALITEGEINSALRFSEGGHMIIEFNGAFDEWEDFAAGSAIYKTYGKYARDITSTRTWNQIADRISRGFLVILPIIQPDVIIVGGSIGTFFEKYESQLIGILKEKLPESIISIPKFTQAKHPEEAVIYGCYYYAVDQLAD